MLGTFAFYACENGESGKDETPEEQVSTHSDDDGHDHGSDTFKTNDFDNLPPAPNVSGQGDEKLNPPHGEPGHRCEIPVGAPLDGAPVAPPESAKPSAEAVKADGGDKNLNPPHGEPGHRCEIPVGSPLN